MVREVIRATAAVCALAFAGSVLAQGSGSGGGSSTAVERGDWSRVQDVQPDAGRITVEDGRRLEVDKRARVTRDGVQSSLADVQPGDEVRATYLHGTDEGPIMQVDARSRGRERSSY